MPVSDSYQRGPQYGYGARLPGFPTIRRGGSGVISPYLPFGRGGTLGFLLTLGAFLNRQISLITDFRNIKN